MSVPFEHPFTCLLSGPTNSGKTNFVLRLIDCIDEMIRPRPRNIIYYYSEYQQVFDRYSDLVSFRQGLPKAGELEDVHDALLILDDMMSELDQNVLNLFARGSHHRNLSVLCMVQNFFVKNKHMRSISLNAQYIVLFKNPRDASQFTYLARQLYPQKYRFAEEAFKDATREAYSYLLVDCRADQFEELRLRTNVFPGERQQVYVPR